MVVLTVNSCKTKQYKPMHSNRGVPKSEYNKYLTSASVSCQCVACLTEALCRVSRKLARHCAALHPLQRDPNLVLGPGPLHPHLAMCL